MYEIFFWEEKPYLLLPGSRIEISLGDVDISKAFFVQVVILQLRSNKWRPNLVWSRRRLPVG